MNLNITEIEKDIIREMVNIGVAKAADSFAIIAKEKVLINAPKIKVVDIDSIKNVVADYEKNTVIIQSDIKGDLDGKTFLLFSEPQAMGLAKICLGSFNSNGYEEERLKNSLLLEIGNIITGAIATQFSNILRLSVFGGLPILKNNFIGNILKSISEEYPVFKPLIFTIKTEFVYSYKSYELPLVLVFDLQALIKILAILRESNLEKFELLKNS